MNREEALTIVETGLSASLRLEAARVLEHTADAGDLKRLQRAIAGEADEYVRNSLETSIARLAGLKDLPSTDKGTDERFSVMVEDASALLLHELRPAVGAVVEALIDECSNYESTSTYAAISSLRRKMSALGSLKTASRAPHLTEFDLGDLVREVLRDEGLASVVSIVQRDEIPLVVVGDRGLLSLAIANGVRNAVDVVAVLPDPSIGEVIVNWGADPDAAWVVVLDNGPGLPPGADRLWEIGASSKSKAAHDGLGLPIARRAARSLGGEAMLRPRQGQGAAFEIRWPIEASS